MIAHINEVKEVGMSCLLISLEEATMIAHVNKMKEEGMSSLICLELLS